MDKTNSDESLQIRLGSRSPPPPSTTTTTATTSRGSSVSVKTLREVVAKQLATATVQRINDNKEEGDQNEGSTPVISPSATLTDSRSSADIPSELLDLDSDSQQSDVEQEIENRPPDKEYIPTNRVHGHLLPTGWACKYDSSTDQYRFEYRQHQTIAHGLAPTEVVGAKSSRLDQVVVAQTPTQDDTVQTSRRPTWHLFECKYGYHFPSSPTSSMISELARQVQKGSTGQTGGEASSKQAAGQKSARQIGYGKHKLVVPSDEDEQAARLRDMFPTATQPIIEQMIRIYHGREGLIKAALISLGYKRSTEYNVRKAAAQSPIMLMMSKPSSKKLFDKLIGYFPDKDENLIKGMMYKYKEVEHEIISALVESSQEGGDDSARKQSSSRIDSALRADRHGAIMKLRYLKFLYPDCEEIELYHLLNCNDLNAQKVMELIEQKGHKSVNIEEVMQSRKTQLQQMRAQQAAHAAKDKATSSASDLVQAHEQRKKPTITEARKSNHVANLKKAFEQHHEGLIVGALEATDYNEALARKFLQEMAPDDEALFKQRYERKRPVRPNVVAFPCKSVQKSGADSIETFIASDEYVYIPREVIDCDHALALLKVDASTFTGDDFPKQKFTHRVGRQPDLACGPSATGKEETRSNRRTLQCGPTVERIGSRYREVVCLDPARLEPNKLAVGRNKSLASGRNLSLRCGHNADLVKRTHPFFKEQAH